MCPNPVDSLLLSRCDGWSGGRLVPASNLSFYFTISIIAIGRMWRAWYWTVVYREGSLIRKEQAFSTASFSERSTRKASRIRVLLEPANRGRISVEGKDKRNVKFSKIYHDFVIWFSAAAERTIRLAPAVHMFVRVWFVRAKWPTALWTHKVCSRWQESSLENGCSTVLRLTFLEANDGFSL